MDCSRENLRVRVSLLVKRIVFGLIIFAAAPLGAAASTLITDDLFADTVWTAEGSPYIISGYISVPVGATLTIEPGAIVKFDYGTALEIFGAITAHGTVANKIYFTSLADDSIGGDTNEDGADSEPYYDDEWGIDIIGGDAPASADFSNVSITYSQNGLFAFQSPMSLSNVLMSHIGDGISATAGTVSLANVSMSDIYGDGVSGYNGANFSITSTSLSDIQDGSGFGFYRADADLRNVSVSNISGSGDAFGFYFSTSTLNKVTTTDIGDGSALGLYGSRITVTRSTFDGGSDSGIELYDAGEPSIFTMSTSTVKNFQSLGIGVYSSIATISGSAITDNDVGAGYFGDGSLRVTLSSIMDNSSFGIFNPAGGAVSAENNYWGDDFGPFESALNQNGRGNPVAGAVIFSPWLTYDPTEKPGPLIIIPGIMGSEISKNYGDLGQVWPNTDKLIWSLSDDFLNDLALRSDGTEDPARTMKFPDVVRAVTGSVLSISRTTHVFDGLISKLTGNGYVEGETLFVFPYDWRKSSAENAVVLKQKIEEVRVASGADKIDLIAHSMGGLVAKKYIADNGADKIDQLIFIGTPQLGAPKAFKVLMYGDDMGINTLFQKVSILNPAEIKSISQNMPSAYELLPSKKYVDILGNAYVRDLVTASTTSACSAFNLSYADTESFMKREGRNPAMFPFAENLHNQLDSLDLSGVRTYNFIGDSSPTIGTITATKKKTWTLFGGTKIVDDFKLGYVSGDQTVPTISASFADGRKFYIKGVAHSEMPSAPEVQEKVFTILKEMAPIAVPDIFTGIIHATGTLQVSGIVLSIHSTTTVNIYDDKGNHTGPTPDGNIEFGIPGISYDKINGSTYTFLPAVPQNGSGGGGGGVGTGWYRVVTEPVEIGTYNLNIAGQNENGSTTAEYYWQDIPFNSLDASSEITITASSSADLISSSPSVIPALPPLTAQGGGAPLGQESGGIQSASSSPLAISLDRDGDGTPDTTLPPTTVLDSAQSTDVLPPQTTASTSPGTLVLVPSDDTSGILQTEYSLDGGATWTIYTHPVEISSPPFQGGVGGGSSATTTVLYFSTDKAGNSEPIQEIVVLPLVTIPPISPLTPIVPVSPISATPPISSFKPQGGGPIIQPPTPQVSPVSENLPIVSVSSITPISPISIVSEKSPIPPILPISPASDTSPISDSETLLLATTSPIQTNTLTASVANSGQTPLGIIWPIVFVGTAGVLSLFGYKMYKKKFNKDTS